MKLLFPLFKGFIELKKHNTSTQVANKFGVGRSTLLRHISKYKAVNVSSSKKRGVKKAG